MANAQDIANAVAGYFKAGSSPSAQGASPSPVSTGGIAQAPGMDPNSQAAKDMTSGPGDADQSVAHFHKDLDQSICPDCHDKVKQVMGSAPAPSTESDGPSASFHESYQKQLAAQRKSLSE